MGDSKAALLGSDGEGDGPAVHNHCTEDLHVSELNTQGAVVIGLPCRHHVPGGGKEGSPVDHMIHQVAVSPCQIIANNRALALLEILVTGYAPVLCMVPLDIKPVFQRDKVALFREAKARPSEPECVNAPL